MNRVLTPTALRRPEQVGVQGDAWADFSQPEGRDS